MKNERHGDVSLVQQTPPAARSPAGLSLRLPDKKLSMTMTRHPVVLHTALSDENGTKIGLASMFCDTMRQLKINNDLLVAVSSSTPKHHKCPTTASYPAWLPANQCVQVPQVLCDEKMSETVHSTTSCRKPYRSYVPHSASFFCISDNGLIIPNKTFTQHKVQYMEVARGRGCGTLC